VKRLLGLNILGGLVVILGVSLSVLMVVVEFGDAQPATSETSLVVGFGLIFACIGFGLLRLKRWAYWMTLIGSGFAAPIGLSVLSQCAGRQCGDFLVSGIVFGIVLLALGASAFCYLLRPSVKAQFVRR